MARVVDRAWGQDAGADRHRLSRRRCAWVAFSRRGASDLDPRSGRHACTVAPDQNGDPITAGASSSAAIAEFEAAAQGGAG